MRAFLRDLTAGARGKGLPQRRLGLAQDAGGGKDGGTVVKLDAMRGPRAVGRKGA